MNRIRLALAFLGVMMSAAFGIAVFDATQVTHVAERSSAPESTWEAPPFRVALGADALIGHGALVLPATAYTSCTDTGGGFCVSATGWQLANPIGESLNVNAASWTLTDQATATGGIFSSGATTNDIVGWAFTCPGCTASAAQKNGGVISIAQPAGSNANLLTILDGGTSCVASAQCTAQLTTTTSGAMRLSVDTAASTVGFIYAQGNATGNDVNGTCTGATSEFQINKDNNSNLTIKCNGNGTLQGGWTISGSVPLTFNDGGTSCAGSTQCIGSWTTTAAGNNAITQSTAASTDAFDFSETGTCTAGNYILQASAGGAALGGVLCSGQINSAAGSAFKAGNAGTDEWDANATGANVPFSFISINASAPTGNWFQVCYTSGGGSCGTLKFAVLPNGAIEDSPTINSTTVTSVLPVLYTSAAGAAAGNTAHCVVASAGSIAASGSATITLSNNAVFTSGTSYSVSASISDNTGTLLQNLDPTVRNQSATSFVIDNNDATNAHTIIYHACGT